MKTSYYQVNTRPDPYSGAKVVRIPERRAAPQARGDKVVHLDDYRLAADGRAGKRKPPADPAVRRRRIWAADLFVSLAVVILMAAVLVRFLTL